MENKKLDFTGVALHQGDTQWFELKNLPEGVKKIEKDYIAKSEKSGHAHGLCGDYEMFTMDGFNGHFIAVGSDGATLNHAAYEALNKQTMNKNVTLPRADHNAISLEPNKVYFVGIQRRKEHFQDAWTQVKD
jgi:hypothetical protein